jgi:hypothetical protein
MVLAVAVAVAISTVKKEPLQKKWKAGRNADVKNKNYLLQFFSSLLKKGVLC